MALLVSKKSLLLKIFPPPNLMVMPRMALDISSNSVRFMEIVRSNNGLTLGRFGERRVTEGVGYSDDVQKKGELKDMLIKLKKDYKLKFVDVSLPEEKAYIFQTTLPFMDDSEVRGSIELQIEENVPLSGDEVVFDYSVISRDDKGKIQVGVSVFPRKVIEGFSELFSSVGLVPLSFELAAEAIARAVVKNGDPSTYLIVNFGEKKTGVYIVSNGIVYFTTTLNFGAETISLAISKVLNISKEEAVNIKREKYFMKDKESMKLFFSLLDKISILKGEINKLCVYWNTLKNNEGKENQPIRKIILCGSDSNLPGFDEYLTLTLGIETEVANVWCNIFTFEENIPALSFADSLNYPTVIGLSL